MENKYIDDPRTKKIKKIIIDWTGRKKLIRGDKGLTLTISEMAALFVKLKEMKADDQSILELMKDSFGTVADFMKEDIFKVLES